MNGSQSLELGPDGSAIELAARGKLSEINDFQQSQGPGLQPYSVMALNDNCVRKPSLIRQLGLDEQPSEP